MQTEYDDCLYLTGIIRQKLSEATKQFFNHSMSYRKNPPVGRVRCALPPNLETAETWRVFIAEGVFFFGVAVLLAGWAVEPKLDPRSEVSWVPA